MENYKELIEKIKIEITGDKFLINQLKKTKELLNSNSISSLESNTNLAYWLYVYGHENLALKLCNVLSTTDFDGKFDKWTWVEYSISLAIIIYEQKKLIDNVNALSSILTTPYDSIDKEKKLLNEKALNRRLNGDLLYTAEIEEAIDDKNAEEEIEYRFLQLQELCFIYAKGGSKKFPREKVKNEISENLKKIKRN